MLSSILPVVVIRLTTIFTDVYTFFHIKLSSKQCSTAYLEENHPLEYICINCHTCCNSQSIYKQKLDIPFKSTSFSYILFLLFSISASIQNFVPPYSNHLLLFFALTVNIPLIVYFSRKNNFENMAAERQRTHSLAWNRTEKQNWVRKCAREQRHQAQ